MHCSTHSGSSCGSPEPAHVAHTTCARASTLAAAARVKASACPHLRRASASSAAESTRPTVCAEGGCSAAAPACGVPVLLLLTRPRRLCTTAALPFPPPPPPPPAQPSSLPCDVSLARSKSACRHPRFEQLLEKERKFEDSTAGRMNQCSRRLDGGVSAQPKAAVVRCRGIMTATHLGGLPQCRCPLPQLSGLSLRLQAEMSYALTYLGARVVMCTERNHWLMVSV